MGHCGLGRNRYFCLDQRGQLLPAVRYCGPVDLQIGDKIKDQSAGSALFNRRKASKIQVLKTGLQPHRDVPAAAVCFDVISSIMGLPKERFLHTFTQHGNMAAASIPVALHNAEQKGSLAPGDPILLLGLGACISISLTALIW